MIVESRVAVSRHRAAGFLATIFLSAEAIASIPVAPVAGVVKHLQSPVAGALVFVYGVSDATLNRMKTRLDGSFSFTEVPAGIYDVVAYKSGYYPSLVRLWHQATPGVTALAIDLTPESPVRPARSPTDVWSWRDRMPADVLREIGFEATDRGAGAPPPVEGIRLTRVLSGDFANSQELGSGSSALNRSRLGLSGALPGGIQYGLKGNYATLATADQNARFSSGTAADAALLLAATPESGVGLTYAERSFVPAGAGQESPAWERESVRWTTDEDSSGEKADVSATRSADSGFERATAALPELFAGSSRAYEIRSRWSREADDARYEAALLLRRRDFTGVEGVAGDSSAQDGALTVSAERPVDDWISAGLRLDARYRAAGTSFCPGASLRLKLLPGTAIVLAASRRIGSPAATGSSIAPPTITSEDLFENVSSSEESVTMILGSDPAEGLQLNASRQIIAEPVMVYFDNDLLVDFGSLYLFDGNRLQKVSGTASARLFDLLDAALTAEGGRLDGKLSPESTEQLSVTGSSGDFYRGQAAVTIRPTKTDISCAVRRVRQVLQTSNGAAENFSDLVRVSLAQDLTVLGFYPFGTVWRVTVAYETDNSSSSTDSSIEETASLKHRVMGGLSISF